MKRSEFLKRCKELKVTAEIDGTTRNYGVISIDALRGFLFGGTDIHYASLHLNDSWTMEEAYQEVYDLWLSEPLRKCDYDNCEICNYK